MTAGELICVDSDYRDTYTLSWAKSRDVRKYDLHAWANDFAKEVEAAMLGMYVCLDVGG